MLIMETYLCCCTVRLGVILIAIMAACFNSTWNIILFVSGFDVVEPIFRMFENDAELENGWWLKNYITWKTTYANNFCVVLHIRFFLNTLAAILAIYGALRLKKWLVLPLGLFEVLVFVELLSLHISLMIVLKKVINLGLLIILTLAGTFLLLFIAYNAVTCLAFFQHITVVKSQRYRALYGDDPFNPLLTTTDTSTASTESKHSQFAANNGIVENVRVLITPNDADIDEQKRLYKLAMWPHLHKQQQQPQQQQQQQLLSYPTQIISVIPVHNGNQNYAQPVLHLQTPKWWQKHHIEAADNLSGTLFYRNWQHAELMGHKRRPNISKMQY